MIRDVSLRVGVSESPLPGISCIPRFPRHSKCLSKKALLSSVQNFVIAIGKPILKHKKRPFVRELLSHIDSDPIHRFWRRRDYPQGQGTRPTFETLPTTEIRCGLVCNPFHKAMFEFFLLYAGACDHPSTSPSFSKAWASC